jgi:Mn-dependent DtxR family transcriptional regulator
MSGLLMGGPDRDDETGRFTETYPREEFIEALKEEGGMAGTTDIAENVGVIRETAYKKLSRMEDDGLVQSKKVGNSLVWMTTDENE